ncbi:MAG TPA: hypothetical protein PKA63_07685 [Oligoflexia bacterium]|nr:hypothetical protein [Oligoflexia bacterium]HMP48530.1 hypothetical protein [Oligoflexia bacterium]
MKRQFEETIFLRNQWVLPLITLRSNITFLKVFDSQFKLQSRFVRKPALDDYIVLFDEYESFIDCMLGKIANLSTDAGKAFFQEMTLEKLFPDGCEVFPSLASHKKECLAFLVKKISDELLKIFENKIVLEGRFLEGEYEAYFDFRVFELKVTISYFEILVSNV